jgi:hypothetical protein
MKVSMPKGFSGSDPKSIGKTSVKNAPKGAGSTKGGGYGAHKAEEFSSKRK